MRNLLALMIIAVLAGCEDDGELLTGEDIGMLLNVERRISFSSFRFAGVAVLRPNKTFEVEVTGVGQDTGRWWVDGDKLCSQWKNFRGGSTLCSAVRKQPDGNYDVLRPGANLTLATFRLATSP